MEHANPAAWLLILLFVGPVLLFISRAKKGEKIYVRRIAGIDAIDEAIGRTVELGRPMSFTSGLLGVDPLLYACLGVLRYIGSRAAVFNSRIFVPCHDPEVLVLSDMALQNAYRQEKLFNRYNPSSVRYLSTEQFAYASGYMGLIHRENVGAAFLFGAFAAESLILAEAGQQVGALQVAGTTSYNQIPFFITACDYTVIGEELYAAGAYLSEDPVQTGSLRGQDIAKLVIVLLVLVGIFQATWRSFEYSWGRKEGEVVKIETESLPASKWLMHSWDDLVGQEKDVESVKGGEG